jgi:ribosomal protein S18 acetylase RimI-like enzyme
MNTQLELLQKQDFLAVYQIMNEAFPACERRTYDKALQLLDNPLYSIFTFKNPENRIESFIASWEFEHFKFIEHFAVASHSRGTGIGSQMLLTYLQLDQKPVILEVEDLNTVPAKRRITFYERLGFKLTDFGYMQPALQDTSTHLPLKIMSFPIKIKTKDFLNIKKELYSNVYGMTI